MKSSIYSLKNRRNEFILFFLGVLSLGVYVLLAQRTYRIGFPLDDAWIHQTYARNLAQYHEWSFIPGEPSGGSTAPLWSLLLSLGYILQVNPYGWTIFVGGLLLWGLAILADRAFRKQFAEHTGKLPWVGAVFLLEWHLVWAAGSGMETLLAGLGITAVLLWLWIGSPRWFWLGALVGGLVWVRPDAITLLGPVCLGTWFVENSRVKRVKAIAISLAGFFLFFLPYLGFNRWLVGTWWPNTFYAKQTEYAVLQQIPIWNRLIAEFQIPLVGLGAVLLPGAIYQFYRAFRDKDHRFILGWLWFVGFVGIYAWRLPVTYQHGRYILPALPIYFYWGISGYRAWENQIKTDRIRWVFSRFWALSLIAVGVIFWGLGANAYAKDVAIIESEMVDTARWISTQAPPNALIAAHDIGALGYYGNHPIVDLAGLISPEVIPFMRDEARLAEYLDRRQVAYLMTFPDWYRELPQGHPRAYRSSGSFSIEQGQPNMEVYLWSSY